MDTARGAAASARAVELAYRYLNRRERTVDELRRHLIGRDLDEGAVEAAVAELVKTGYVDDARFARLFAQDKRELQSWGTARIRHAMLSRGIDREVVDSALAEPAEDRARNAAADFSADDAELTVGRELKRAVALLERRFPDPPRERRDRQRALGVLARRGYGLELALEAIAVHCRDGIG